MSDREWRERAERVVAAGASTGSKRPATMFGGEHHDAPSHFVRALGCRVVTVDGATLIDCTMALGAVALGYADDEVVRRVWRVAANGSVAGLNHILEVEIAERLCAVVPCGERALFTKSGAEGVAAAVRLARTYTGRDVVVGSGYFGWLDWCSDSAGVPDGVKRDFVAVPWGDSGALGAAVAAAGDRLAAIVVEPVVEREPPDGWLAHARALADRARAVLVFDEIKTGFRLHPGGYQAIAGVTPDVAVFGKALANGFPLAAVVGHADVMEAARHTWISGTLAGEAVALAAAQAVLDRHEREDVCPRLRGVGARMRGAVVDALDHAGIAGVGVEGLDPMWFIRWSDAARETRFLAGAREAGVLFKRGAYDYAALAHDDEEAISAIGQAAAAGFDAVRRLDTEGQ
ncbi:aminotransferase class-III [Gemmatirosa kalamazoonensis]|uniref:Aminotransferase class-III n=1 Tax=Gemmatirosa kalamazoonensis TaxID=861299 RepID=W0RK70_9BACT|nr:aminotransferase class III-fold pyridoxal phosphate-dependent enzyme [Gemmatirosa kalamazoonensis]AHG91171.1 aminotransferase class-III [Gemmatirosa kalamazoonensis]